MTMTSRERWIAVAAGAALVLFALDQLVLTPVLAYRAAQQATETSLTETLEEAEILIENLPRMRQAWSSRLEAGLSQVPGDAEAALLHAARGWAQQARLNIQSMTPERPAGTSAVGEVLVRLAAHGDMAAVSRFLDAVQKADTPVRVRDLQLTTRREGADDLMVQVRLSTAYVGVAAPPARPGAGRAGGAR